MIITVTGHRPKKLGNAYDVYAPININIAKKMREFILRQWKEHKEPIHLISGMAIGVDTLWALVALKLKKELPNYITLECAIPCLHQESRWSKADQDRYQSILESADKVTFVSKESYRLELMQLRNEYMVDQADIVFAVWDGSRGGTGNCVQYAKEQHRPIYQLHPQTLELTLLSV